MKKITLLLCVALLASFTAMAQYSFPAVVGPTNVAQGTPVTININDAANSAGVPAGSYSTFSVSVDWVDDNNAFSSEADLTMTTSAGSVVINPPTSGGGTDVPTTLTFDGTFTADYDASVNGALDIVLNQSWSGSSANWSNIVVTIIPAITCTAPTATFTVVEDCALGFTVDIDVTDMGDATSYDVQESGSSVGTISGTGITNVGPFTNGNAVDLTLVHNVDTLCNIDEPGLVNTTLCPTTVVCGTPSNATGCYENSTNLDWIFASSDGTSALKITVNAGTVENSYDEFIVYDGADDSAPELYNGYGTAGDLAGLTFNTTGPNMYVRIAGDVSNSCDSGGYTPIDFDVECLSCTPATVTAVVVDDCATSGGFNIEVDITDLGSATTMTVSDDQGSATQAATATGILTFGPYANGTEVAITVANDQDAVCTTSFMGLGQSACPPANDLCAGAEAITVGVGTCGPSVTGNNTGATDSGVDQATCSTATYAGGDIWYSFTVPAGQTEVEYTRSASVFSTTVVELYSGTCGALTELECTTSASYSFTGLTSGATYLLRLYDWSNNDIGDVTFCLGTPPTCLEPTAGSATSITDTSADLGWTEAGTATTWNIEWGTAPLTQGAGTMVMGTTTNPYALTGLTADTEYEYYVQADCGGGDTSAWAGPFSFTTSPPPPACGGNFYDNGGVSSDYASSTNETTTICPDVPGDAVNVTFTFFSTENNGSTDCWDGLTIYDGPDNTYPIISPTTGDIWCWDRDEATPSGTGDLQGMTITSTDGSGCLTFVFTSDSSFTREGWEATVACTPLSLEDYGLTGFTYFPNPVNNVLSLRGAKEINNIAIYNMLGQEVLRTAPNAVNTDVDMSNLQAGAYFVKVTIGNATKTVKVIKN